MTETAPDRTKLPTSANNRGRVVLQALAALGLSVAPLLLLALLAPWVRVGPLAAIGLSFVTATTAIVLHTAKSPWIAGATPRGSLAAALGGAVIAVGANVLGHVAKGHVWLDVLSSVLNSAGVLAAGTAVGALVGSRVANPGHLMAVAFASSAADLWSVHAPEGVTHAVVVAARDPVFQRLLTVSAAVPPERTGEAAIGLGDVAFCAIYLGTIVHHRVARARTLVALTVGLLAAGAATFALRVPMPALPFLGVCVLALEPAARRVSRKDRAATALSVLMLVAAIARVAWAFRRR